MNKALIILMALLLSQGAVGALTNNVSIEGILDMTANNVHLEQNCITCDFTNESGGTLSIGDVVVIDTAHDISVTTTTEQLDKLVAGVVVVGGGNLAIVKVAIDGIATANVTGATSIGNYLTTSATKGKADPYVATEQGTFGVALTSGSGTVTVLLEKDYF